MRHAVCRMSARVNRRRVRGAGMTPAIGGGLNGRRPVRHEGTPRCAVSSCPRDGGMKRHGHGDSGAFVASSRLRLRYAPPVPRLRAGRKTSGQPAGSGNTITARQTERQSGEGNGRCPKSENPRHAWRIGAIILPPPQTEPGGAHKVAASPAGRTSGHPTVACWVEIGSPSTDRRKRCAAAVAAVARRAPAILAQ